MADNETCMAGRDQDMGLNKLDIKREIVEIRHCELEEINNMKAFVEDYKSFASVLFDKGFDMVESDEIQFFGIYIANRR